MSEPANPAANPPAAVNATSGNGQGLQQLADGSWIDPEVDPALIADWWWAVQERSSGRFDDYPGEHLAILNHRLIDRDRDPNAVRLRAAEATGVHPERIVVLYVDPE